MTMPRHLAGHPPRCEHCDLLIVGQADSALGSGWKHRSSNAERCADGRHVATPAPPTSVAYSRAYTHRTRGAGRAR